MQAKQFFKCLSDENRLTILLLISLQHEVCVCDLVAALAIDQPSVSRHLAQLRKCLLLQAQRKGKWMYYRLHPDLADWCKQILQTTAEHQSDMYQVALQRLLACQTSQPCN